VSSPCAHLPLRVRLRLTTFLRLFVVPVEPTAISQTVDNAAARIRSPIRRQRTAHIRQPGTGAETLIRHADASTDGDSNRQNAERDAATAGGRERISQRRRLLDGTEWTVTQVPAGRTEFQILDGPVQTPRSPPIVSSDTSRMPPVPESGDFQTTGPSNSTQTARGGRPFIEQGNPRVRRRRPPPSTSYLRSLARPENIQQRRSHGSTHASESALRAAWSDNNLSAAPPLPSLTPNFAPARQYSLEDPRTRETDPTMFGEATSSVSLPFRLRNRMYAYHCFRNPVGALATQLYLIAFVDYESFRHCLLEKVSTH
jgi:hypothetical protein